MKKAILAAIACVLIMTSLSCVTVRNQVIVESNADSEYQGLSDNIYITIEIGNLQIGIPKKVTTKELSKATEMMEETTKTIIEMSPLSAYLKNAFEHRFGQLGINVKAEILTGLELEPNSEDRGRIEIGADSTMQLIRTGEKTDTYYNPGFMAGNIFVPGSLTTITTYSFEASIHDYTLDRMVWRSRMTVVGSFSPETVNEMIHDLLVAMNNDGMLKLAEDQINSM